MGYGGWTDDILRMDQIERIKRMERKLNRVSKAVKQLSSALNKYSKVQDDLQELEAYYGSEDWEKDFADDEKGLLPSDLKRGVLAEDAIWNVLEENSALPLSLPALLPKYGKKG